MYHSFLLPTLEVTATVCAIVNVYLLIRCHIWNWIFGIVAVCIYSFLFFHVKLYADMALQFVYLILQCHGWYSWLQHTRSYHGPIRNANLRLQGKLIGGTGVLFLIISACLAWFTDSTMVYCDALITALSITAFGMMSGRWLQHWWVWMAVNVLSVYVYYTKGLYVTSGLYCVFFCTSVVGYQTWRRHMR